MKINNKIKKKEKNLWFILMELKMKLLKINFIVFKLYLYLKIILI